MKSKRFSKMALKRFWKQVAAFLYASFAATGAFIDRYFGNGFRAKEFATVVAAAFVAGVWLGTQLALTLVYAQIVGYALAIVTAVAYIRNPRNREWHTGSPVTELVPSDSANVSDDAPGAPSAQPETVSPVASPDPERADTSDQPEAEKVQGVPYA